MNNKTEFNLFKRKLIPYLMDNPYSSRSQIEKALEQKTKSVNAWLLDLVKAKEIARHKDESYQGYRYLYSLPSEKSAIAVETEVIPDGVTDSFIWELVLKNVSPFAASVLKESRLIQRVNRRFVVELKKNQPLPDDYKVHVLKVVAAVCGGNAEDYQVAYVFPAINFQTQEINREPVEPVFQSIPDEIKSEFSIDSTGKATISIRGAARLLGIAESSLREGARNNDSKLAQSLTGKGFEGARFASDGIPDTAFSIIALYYAYKAGRHCTAQAEAICEVFEGIGVRTWIQEQLKWTPTLPTPIVQTQSVSVDNKIDALLAVSQNLIAAIVDTRQIAQSAQSGVIEIKNYLDRKEEERKQAEKTLGSILEPTVEAPQKTPRMQLRLLIDKYCFVTGKNHKTVWSELHREIEVRCEVSLHNTLQKLIQSGKKDANKLDAIEHLGLMEKALAITVEVLEVA